MPIDGELCGGGTCGAEEAVAGSAIRPTS